MSGQFATKTLITGVLAAFLVVLGVNAQQDRPAAAATPAVTATKGGETGKPAAIDDKVSNGGQTAQPIPSPGVTEVVNMLEAGVSKEVVKAYIENSATAYNPSPADLIALKQHGVADDVTLALLNHGSEAGARAAHALAVATTPAAVPVQTAEPAVATPVRIVNSYAPDPESYDYFQRYYLPQNPRQCLSNSRLQPVFLWAGFFPVLRPVHFGGLWPRSPVRSHGPPLPDFSALTRLRLSSAKHPGSLEPPGPVGAGYRVFGGS